MMKSRIVAVVLGVLLAVTAMNGVVMVSAKTDPTPQISYDVLEERTPEISCDSL